jgi:hypothetical protein
MWAWAGGADIATTMEAATHAAALAFLNMKTPKNQANNL